MQTPSWVEFQTRPVGEFDLDSPAAELALLLQRYRADLDAAARASADGRQQALRLLADQAVLAIELERALEPRPDGAPYALREGLRAVKDRMLGLVEAAGLQVVRLQGADAATVAALAHIDSWRYDELYTREVAVEELEVAVLHLGAPLRRGRVVMGAPPGGGPRPHDDPLEAGAPVVDVPLVASVQSTSGLPRLVCPVADCGVENEPDAEVCVACLTQLGGYRRLSMYPQVLFNRGLAAARAGDSHAARDCFAAVVLWLPNDLEARKAYALACLESHDVAAARRAWQEVLARAPGDPLARRGMRALMRAITPVRES